MTARRTSREAYHEIADRGLLSAARWKVYNWLYHDGPLTGSELNGRALDSGTPGLHKRLSELKDLGVVCEVRERKCKVTGRTAIEWDVTEHLPKTAGKRYHRPTPAEISRALEIVDYWKRLATMRGAPEDPEVEKVLAWLRRKAR